MKEVDMCMVYRVFIEKENRNKYLYSVNNV